VALNLNPNSDATPADSPTEAIPDTAPPTGKKDKKARAAKAPKASKVRRPGRGRKVLGLTIASVLGVVAAGGAFAAIEGAKPASMTVYQLTGPVAANTAATVDMFRPVQTPINSIEGGYVIPEEELNGQAWFAEEDLLPGALATDSNFSRNTRIAVESLNDPSLLAQTFTADVEDAVGGRLRAGDYVSILQTVNTEGGAPDAQFVLERVLLLDVSGEPGDGVAAGAGTPLIGSEAATADNARYTGVPRLYTVALNPEQTRKLTAAKSSGGLTVVLTRADAPNVDGRGGDTDAPDTSDAPADPAPIADPASTTDATGSETTTDSSTAPDAATTN